MKKQMWARFALAGVLMFSNSVPMLAQSAKEENPEAEAGPTAAAKAP